MPGPAGEGHVVRARVPDGVRGDPGVRIGAAAGPRHPARHGGVQPRRSDPLLRDRARDPEGRRACAGRRRVERACLRRSAPAARPGERREPRASRATRPVSLVRGHRRRLGRDAPRARARGAGGDDRRDGTYHGGDRHRQGTCGAGDSPALAARPGAVRQGQLRGDSRDAARLGAVRARARRVHRRARTAARALRAGRSRDGVPRRDRRAVCTIRR